MKKSYEKPTIEVTEFQSEDIITLSGKFSEGFQLNSDDHNYVEY